MFRACAHTTQPNGPWRLQSRFLSWPLDRLEEKIAATRHLNLFSKRAKASSYPIRALRYWWVDCFLAEEIERMGRTLTVLDAGCSKGEIKTYLGDTKRLDWIGVDWRVDEQALSGLGYDRIYQHDLNKSLPLPDGSVDVVVFLHVAEHLPSPAYTVTELSRILRPGGVLLGGSPILPKAMAQWRRRQHLREFQEGARKPGEHIQSFSPHDWRAFLASTGFTLEMMNGAFLCRWSGTPLESMRWWIRLNQLWGAVFPSLGGELYVVGRKGHACSL